ncbi:metallophosphoesterase [Sinorhizobium meliloti]|uniref:metallophosphoesterase n=1 Tax=Rhizobium meliloti TaxID=382 RepID=UPI00299E7569|nr:hypothetical protein [Sinorhizobium meliloti]
MRAWIFSDLHLEFDEGVRPLAIPDADICICAGDILDGGPAASVDYLGTYVAKFMPVVFVPGNHEYYRSSIVEGAKLGSELAAAFPNLHFLNRDAIWLGGYRFIGATLWSDFGLYGDRGMGLVEAQNGLNDYRKIKMSKKPFKRFSSRKAHALYTSDRYFIKSALWTPCLQPTIVVTHHAPSVLSVLPEFMDDPLTPSFVASFEADIVKYQPRLWVHGHLPNRSDYYIRNTRVICNPRGYPGEEQAWDFDPFLVVDLSEIANV